MSSSLPKAVDLGEDMSSSLPQTVTGHIFSEIDRLR